MEHFAEKACPGLDPGWRPVFRRKCDQLKNLALRVTIWMA
jgi:hypothetical protein